MEKNIEKERILIDKHRFDHQNIVMLDRKENIEKEEIPIENPGRVGKKVGQKVGQKIVQKTRIVIDNHRFDHKNNVMLEREKTLQKKES